jgi:hypothetical protein
MYILTLRDLFANKFAGWKKERMGVVKKIY